MKKVWIEIKGTQDYDGESDVTRLTTEGFFGYDNGVYRIRYDESELLGVAGVKTELTVENNTKMVLSRTGGMEGSLTVEKGRRHSCFYNTPQGSFVLGIFGETLRSDLSAHGGNLYMAYTIDVNSGLVSRNQMEIKVKEIESPCR